jgi:hypothetical protein
LHEPGSKIVLDTAALLHDQHHDLARRRAERCTHADLLRALSHAVREAAVEPDHRDEECEDAKAAEQSGIQARPGIEPPNGLRQI